MLILRPRLEAVPLEVLRAPARNLPSLDHPVVVVIPLPPAVPEFIAIPDRAELEVAKVRRVTKQRRRPGRVASERVHRHARVVGPEDVAGPRVVRKRESGRVEVLIELQVLREHALRLLARGRTAEVHRDGGVHRVDDTDVGVLDEPGEDGAGLGLGQRIGAGAELGVAAAGEIATGFRTPVVGIVAVQVEAADAVLVDAAVLVVVDALVVGHVVARA